MRELTFKQRLFVEAYIGEANGNGTEAARIAGYSYPSEQSYQLLQKTTVRAAINRRLKTAAMAANEVLARISEIATADIGEFIRIDSSGGYSLNLKKTQRTRLIKKLKQTRTTDKDDNETVVTDFEVKDSFPALVKLGEYHGLWKDQEAPVDDGLMEDLEKRAAQRSSKKPASGHFGPVSE